MKKHSLVCGLIPALTLGICSTGLAQSVTDSSAEVAPVAVVEEASAPVAPVKEMTEAETIEELRARIEEKLQATKELKARLSTQLELLQERAEKAERKSWEQKVEVHGYGRIRHEKHHFEDFDAIDKNTMRLNLFTKYRIDDKWSIKSEAEFEDNLSQNTGAYGNEAKFGYKEDGKQYSREIMQLYAEGRIGEVDVKIGRYFLESPHKLTFDEKVDGVQFKWGTPSKWGWTNFTLSAGNTWSTVMYGDTDNTINRYETGFADYKVWSLMGEIPVMKNTNIVAHYGKVTSRRNSDMTRKTFSYGFDTKITPELKFSASTAKSDSSTLNKSYFMQLKYKEANPAVPGSYGLFIKKYLRRGHTGLTKWYMDDIAGPTDYAAQLKDENGVDPWVHHRSGEFNGICVGTEFVPTRNTKMKLEYTFGKHGLFDAGTGKLTGERKAYSFLSAQWELFF